MNIKTANLLGDRLLVQEIQKEDFKSKGGLILPETEKDRTAAIAKVVNVSTTIKNADVEDERLAPGNIVVYSKFAGTPFSQNGQEFTLLRITDLYAVEK